MKGPKGAGSPPLGDFARLNVPLAGDLPDCYKGVRLGQLGKGTMHNLRCQLTAALFGASLLTASAATTRYVNVNSATPTPPYTNWATAAKLIQDAVDAATTGDEIVVTNGVYTTGGQVVSGMSNRVAVTKPLTLRSVNGPDVTIICGCQVPGTTNGAAAIRCAYLTKGAVLSGFTLTNGATQTSGVDEKQHSGGGVWCESPNVVVTDCVLTGNSAYNSGGGAFSGTLNNCTLTGNFAHSGGGASSATLNDCTLTANSAYSGGGACYGTLNNCTLMGNSASGNGGGAREGTLNHCTLTGNSAYDGGGAYYATLKSCVLTSNSASGNGGGAYCGMLNNCTLAGNSAYYGGGGAYSGTLNHCTLTGNSASQYGGGGARFSTLNNCILYYNTAPNGRNFDSCTLNYCCTLPLPSTGTGNISAEPLLASLSHLSSNSPCRGAGSAVYASGQDLDGEPWASPPSMGCDEFWSESATGAVSVAIGAAYTNVAAGFNVDFSALIDGRVSASQWGFADGVTVSNQPCVSHSWLVPGDYRVELRAFNETYPAGVAATVLVRVVAPPEHYVAVGSSNPVPPYSSWAMAATNIQDALDVAVPGALVLVTNGIYAAGGRAVYATMTNRVAITKPLTLRSVNGPEFTVIQGYQVPGTTNGVEAIRCVSLASGAVLSGFTLTNGATQFSWEHYEQKCGGGVLCESVSAVVTNCVLTGNSASSGGGGAYSGMLNNCTLTGNSAAWSGGGAFSGMLNNCTLTGNSAAYYGGGAYSGMLNNCTLTGNSAAWHGGGASSGTLNNCTLTGNSAAWSGGGAYSGTLNNCMLTANSVSLSGGGASSGTLNNCTLTGNSAAWSGGGAYSGKLNNCILYYNTAPDGGNFESSCTLDYCCATPLPFAGTGNITNAPLLASLSHLSAASPCRGTGSAAYTTGLDIDGEPWANLPSIGCDEFWSGSVTGALSVTIAAAYTNVAVGLSVDFRAMIDGRVSASRWDFGDGATVSNQPCVAHSWATPGEYVVTLRAFNETHPDGVTGTMVVRVLRQPVHYVAMESVSPVPPYSSWATAATNIQEAVDGAVAGGEIVVTNGVYATGGRAVYGKSNRVAVTKPLTVRSVNGPGVTRIVGCRVPITNNEPLAVRCVYMANGAILSGFTLTNGATPATDDFVRGESGGGVWCESPSAVVSNCVLTGNSASQYGGGAYYATLKSCVLTSNSAFSSGGGAYSCTLDDCTLTGNSSCDGGGASSGTLNHCTLTDNSAVYGGGASSCTLNDCTLTGNLATDGGGGASSCTLDDCTLTGNLATDGGGAYYATLKSCVLTSNSASSGGGAYVCTLNHCTLAGNSAHRGGGDRSGTLINCVVYYNGTGPWGNYYGSMLDFCCTTPMAYWGVGNITNAPLFVATHDWSDLRLQSNSPCINGGNNALATGPTDLDGLPRIVGGTVDMGAYEFQSPASTLSYAWAQKYGLPTDGSADFVDPDLDGHNNWQEWRADTSPTNALSRLALVSPTNAPTGMAVTWQSVAARSYFLERGTNLADAPAMLTLATNILGKAGTTTFTDTTATNGGPYFYRVGVQ